MDFPRFVVTGASIDGDAEDALALFQVVETWVNEAVAVVFACCLDLGQIFGLSERKTFQHLLTFGCGYIDGVGDAVAYGNQVVRVLTPMIVSDS